MGMSSARVAPSARMASSRATFATAAPRTARQARVMRILPNGQLASGFSSFGSSTSFRGTFRKNPSSNFRPGARGGPTVFVPLLYGGYPYYGYPYYDDSSYYDPTQQQSQGVDVQQSGPVTQQDVDPGYDAANSPPPLAPAPVRDVGEFVLVRKDGRILFASAFSITGSQLTYVTPEGIRRSLPMTELDADATQQMNEARGTTVQIRN